MRTRDRADDVEGVFDVGDPVAHRFVERVFQGARAAFDRHHRRAEQLHAIDVGGLAPDVFGAHVDHALHAEARRHGRARDAMLAGAGLGDHARLAHALGEQRLADGVVDLVRAGVIEVFTLEEDLGAAEHLAPALGVIDRARTADVMLEFAFEFGDELGVFAVMLVSVAQFGQRVHQGLGDEHAAVLAEVPLCIGQVVMREGNRRRLVKRHRTTLRRARGRSRALRYRRPRFYLGP